jgi:integrase
VYPTAALRKAFERARRLAGIHDFRFHDFRHTAKTRWAEMAIAPQASMLAAGRRTLQMHSRYVNMREKELKAAFGGLIAVPP